MEQVKITSQERFYRQVNYTIIKSLWKYVHPQNKIEELYQKLNVTRNYMSRIVTGNTYNTPDLNRKWQSRTNDGAGLYVLGLPKPYMLGEEMITIDGVKQSDWEEFIKNKYEKVGGTKDEREIARYKFYKKLHMSFDSLRAGGVRQTSDRAIDILYYYMVNGHAKSEQDTKDLQIKELLQAMKQVRAHHWKSCEDSLLEESIENLKNQLNMARAVSDYKNMK